MKKHRPLKIILVVMLAAALALYLINDFIGGQGLFVKGVTGGYMVFVPTGVTIEFDRNSGAAFHCPGGKGFFFATRDGVRYITDDGKTQMAESYTMQNPILFGDGQITGVVEPSGYDAYIFNTQGLIYTHHFNNPIVNFTVNPMGYSCVVTKKDDEYESFVYNQNGALLQRSLSTGVAVSAVDISSDGRIWAVAYLDFNGAHYNSYITFSYLNKSEAAGYNDSIFASLKGENVPELTDQYFSIIRFIDGNNLVVVTEKNVFCVNPSSASKPSWVMELDNELDALAFYGGNVAVAMGKGLINRTAEPLGRVVLLDKDGNRTLEIDYDEKVTSLLLSSNGLITGRRGKFTGLSLKGQELWTHEAVYDAKAMFFLDSSDKVILQTGSDASVMKLTKISRMEE